MALPFISFNRDANSADIDNPIYYAQLIEETVDRLKENFRHTRFYPFFVYGQAQNKILAFLLKCPEIENPEQQFVCENTDGVCVWPKPLKIAGIDLMLLNLGEPADESFTNYINLRERVMMGLVMLSSVCCLCEENSKIITRIKKFVDNYSSICGSVKLEISKFVAFDDGAWLDSNSARVNPLRERLKQRLATSCRDNDTWIAPLINSLDQSSDPFIISHNHLFGEGYISAFLKLTAGFIEKGNIDQDFTKFVSAVRSCFHPCVNAQRLMEFVLSEPRKSTPYSLTLKLLTCSKIDLQDIKPSVLSSLSGPLVETTC